MPTSLRTSTLSRSILRILSEDTIAIISGSPSGTAITLAEEIVNDLDRKTAWVKGEQHLADGTVEGTNVCEPAELPIESIRRDEVPGIHSIIYNSEADCITITHDAHSRKGFALGAVLAAEFTKEHEGLLTIGDMFKF